LCTENFKFNLVQLKTGQQVFSVSVLYRKSKYFMSEFEVKFFQRLDRHGGGWDFTLERMALQDGDEKKPARAVWSRRPPDQSPSAFPPDSVLWRKDKNFGYEHRWTPKTVGGLYDTMSKQPGGLLGIARSEMCHIQPAGLQSKRIVSPLDMRMTFGSANAQLPEQAKQRYSTVEFVPLGSPSLTRPTPSAMQIVTQISEMPLDCDGGGARPGNHAAGAGVVLGRREMGRKSAWEQPVCDSPTGVDAAADRCFVDSPADVTALPHDWMQARSPSIALTREKTSIAGDAVLKARECGGSSFLEFCFDPKVARDRILDTRRVHAPGGIPGNATKPQLTVQVAGVGRMPRLPVQHASMSSARVVPPPPISKPWGCVEALVSPRYIKGFEVGAEGPLPPFTQRIQDMARTERGLVPKPLLLPMHRIRSGVHQEREMSIATLSDLMFRRSTKLSEQGTPRPAGLCSQHLQPPGKRR
jgi:hypothetical protein